MEKEQQLITHFLRSGGFKELTVPVIVTSGEFLTPFFCNAEMLCGDSGINAFLSDHGDDPERIIQHAVALSREHPPFCNVIDAMSARAAVLLKASQPERISAVSGGQRRDWLFSGPVADRLGLPHISIFKDQHTALHPAASGRAVTDDPDLHGYRVVHVADLITRGSSIFSEDPETGVQHGWVPVLRSRGAETGDLITAVSRNQGGEEMLELRGVSTYAFITVNEDFISRYAENPEPILGFLEDPPGWTRLYLTEHGPGILMNYCSNDPKKLPRLEKFIASYTPFLREKGWLEMLEEKVETVKQRGTS